MKLINTKDMMPGELRSLADDLNAFISCNQDDIKACWGDFPLELCVYAPVHGADQGKWLLGWNLEGIGPSAVLDTATGAWYWRDAFGIDKPVLGLGGADDVLTSFCCALTG